MRILCLDIRYVGFRTSDWKELAREDDTYIEAIRVYRKRYGTTLKEAHDVVSTYRDKFKKRKQGFSLPRNNL